MEKTRKNVDSINKVHAFYSKKYPGSFGDTDTYLYTLCFEAAGMHRLMMRIGQPGMSDKEQLAAVKYWSKMTGLFKNIDTGENITGFPESFEGVMQFMDRFEKDGLENATARNGNYCGASDFAAIR